MAHVTPGTKDRDWLAWVKHRRMWARGGDDLVASVRVTEERDARVTQAGDQLITEPRN